MTVDLSVAQDESNLGDVTVVFLRYESDGENIFKNIFFNNPITVCSGFGGTVTLIACPYSVSCNLVATPTVSIKKSSHRADRISSIRRVVDRWTICRHCANLSN